MTSSQLNRAYALFHDGVCALSALESNGMRIDVPYLDRQLQEIPLRIRNLTARLQETDVWRHWTKRYGASANITSREQLGVVLFDVMKLPAPPKTVGGDQYSTEVDELEKVDIPFVKGYLKLAKLNKVYGTNLKGLKRELVGERIHPVFNLHIPVTYRSSSDSPNFQNFPVRDPAMAKIVRDCFIASDGCQIVENDFKGAEVCVAACYNHDPNLIAYIEDPTKDMHRDVAMQLFFLDAKDVKKDIRHAAKNKFVFPEFYGDWYLSCAQALWDAMERQKFKGPDGQPLASHLLAHGISRLGDCDPGRDPRPGTFEHHVKMVEGDFWNNRFKVYTAWKESWWQKYQQCGYIDFLTGFRVEGDLQRNKCINYPVQGSAFHCLLWSLIQLLKALKHYKMKAKVVGQIHDSIVADVPTGEVNDYLSILYDIVGNRLPKHWPWIIVPMTIETEIVKEGGTWNDKKAATFKDGELIYE